MVESDMRGPYGSDQGLEVGASILRQPCDAEGGGAQ